MITRKEIDEVLIILLKGSNNPENLEYIENHQIVNGIEFEMVEQVGGEGKGDYCHIVSKLTRGDDIVLIKHIGFYSSYNGVEFGRLDDYYIVEPVEVVKIEYRRVKE